MWFWCFLEILNKINKNVNNINIEGEEIYNNILKKEIINKDQNISFLQYFVSLILHMANQVSSSSRQSY